MRAHRLSRHGRFTLVATALVLCSLMFIAGAAPQDARAQSHPGTITRSLAVAQGVTLHIRGDLTPVLVSTSGRPAFAGVWDKVFVFDTYRLAAKAGRLTVTVRHLPGDDAIVFGRFDAAGSGSGPELMIEVASDSSAVHRFDAVPNLTYDAHVGVDITSGPMGYVEFSRDSTVAASVLVSKQYEFRTLTQTYGDGRVSSVREIKAERATMGVNRGPGGAPAVSMRLDASSASCVGYFTIVHGPAVEDAAQEEALKTIACSEWRWREPLGAYAKYTYGVVPTTKAGYTRSYLAMRSNRVLRTYRDTGSRMMRAMVYDDLYTFMQLRSWSGLWLADCTNNWVARSFSVNTNYVDTRHNADISLWMLDAVDVLGIKDTATVGSVRSSASAFGNYLVSMASRGAIARTTGGYFFRDYYDRYTNNTGHTSLNHALAEMNYLYRLHTVTGNAAYYTVAQKIRQGVRDTYGKWVTPTGDLYYQVRSGVFSGTDYYTVTLYDLMLAQTLIEQKTGARDTTFDYLITKKLGWLQAMKSGQVTPDAVGPGEVTESTTDPMDGLSADRALAAQAAVEEGTAPIVSAVTPASLSPGVAVSGYANSWSGAGGSWTINLAEGDLLRLHLSGPVGTDFASRVSLLGATGAEQVAVDGSWAYGATLNMRAPSAGTYRVDVFSIVGAGAFTLVPTVYHRAADDVMPGVLLAGSGVDDTINAVIDPVDVHAIDLAAGEWVTAQVTASGPVVSVRVVDASGRTVAGQHRGSVAFRVPADGAGRYAVIVRALANTGPYRLDVGRTVADDPLPGPVRAAASSGWLSWRTDPVAVSAVHLAAGERLVAVLTRPASADMGLDIVAPGTGSTLEAPAVAAGGGVGPVLVSTFVASVEGTYTIRVTATDGSGTYQLAQGVYPRLVDDVFPGVSVVSGRVNGSASKFADPYDIHRIWVPSGATLSVSLSGAAGSDLDLKLSGPATTAEADSMLRVARSNVYPEKLVYQAPAGGGGYHYVTVQAMEGAGAYTLDLSVR